MTWRSKHIKRLLGISTLVLFALLYLFGSEALAQDSLGQDSVTPPILFISNDTTPTDAPTGAAAGVAAAGANDTIEDDYKPLPYFKPIFGLGGGFLTYFGDLTPFQAGSRITDNLAFDFSISTRTNRYLTMELYFLKGRFTVDEQSDTRNLNFQTSVEIGGLSFSHNFGNFIPERIPIHPYISFGVEGFNFNSKGDTLDANGNPYYYWKDGTIRTEEELGTNPNAPKTSRDFLYESDLREANLDGLKRYSQFSFAIPVGIGVQYRFNRRLAVDLGTEMHFTFTDNLDNVSAKGNGIREGGEPPEKFLYTSITLRYNIGKDDPEQPEEEIDTCLIDDDNDGVNNCIDQCPDTPDSLSVDSVGCPVMDTVAIVDTLPLKDTLVSVESIESDSVWTLLLRQFGPGEYPDPDFINEVLRLPGVWTEEKDGTTYFIQELYGNPDKAEAARRNIENNTGIEGAKIILWEPMLDYKVSYDSVEVNKLMSTSQQLNNTDVFFRVQLGAFSTKISTDVFNIDDVVMIPSKDQLFKYLTGEFKNDFESADKHREAMKKKGFEDAFIVAYRGGERVPLEEVGIGVGEDQVDVDTAGGVEVTPPEEQVLTFKIQIYASKDPIYLAPANFKGVENIEEYEEGGLFKYTFGSVGDFGYARDVLLNQMRRTGYKDAFVVAFLNNQRITIEKALEIKGE